LDRLELQLRRILFETTNIDIDKTGERNLCSSLSILMIRKAERLSKPNDRVVLGRKSRARTSGRARRVGLLQQTRNLVRLREENDDGGGWGAG